MGLSGGSTQTFALPLAFPALKGMINIPSHLASCFGQLPPMGLSPVVSRSCGGPGRAKHAESLNQALQSGHALAQRPQLAT